MKELGQVQWPAYYLHFIAHSNMNKYHINLSTVIHF